jgi:alkylhydroperoxidase/carboxymuconolactone decarboxylase family protein
MEMKTYYNPEDLKKFGNIGDFDKPLAEKFFSWYGDVFAEGALTAREKSLIALAVAHTIQCPYCIDAYSEDTLAKGLHRRADDGSSACGCSHSWRFIIGSCNANDE